MITVIASRKGGAGKSTITCNIAAILVSAGKKVAIADFDPQGTAMNWGNVRAERDDVNSVPIIPCRAGKQALKTLKDLGNTYDHVLVDLQGVDSEENRYVLTLADKIILPFKPSQPDLDTIPYISEMIEQLQEIRPGASPYYVINEAPTTTGREKVEALEYFQNYDIKPIPTILHARKAYRDSMAYGLGAVELKDEKARNEISAAFSDIFG